MSVRSAASSVLAAVALVSSVALAAPAQAATGYDRCPSGRLCLFTGTGGTGTMATYLAGDANMADSTGPTGMNNNVESVWNRTSMYFMVWDGRYYTGDYWTITPGTKGTLLSSIRNRISSVCELRGVCTP